MFDGTCTWVDDVTPVYTPLGAVYVPTYCGAPTPQTADGRAYYPLCAYHVIAGERGDFGCNARPNPGLN